MPQYSFFGDSSYKRLAEPRIQDFSRRMSRILYATRSSTTKTVADLLASALRTTCVNISEFSFDSITELTDLVVVIGSDAGGLPVPDGLIFFRMLEDLAQDFRVERTMLSNVRVTVVGVGSIEYGIDNFCVAARTMHSWFKQLGAVCEFPAVLITDTEELSMQVNMFLSESRFDRGGNPALQDIPYILSWDKSSFVSRTLQADEDEDDNESDSESTVSDSFAVEDAEGCSTKEMLTARQRKQLEKEGYKIIGSHSAVKLCRWTKHHTRGRGGCYKHTFYGISSMNCMEATPSLACANKCVFCWRHHKNPVGTSWTWKTDPADEIVAEAIKLHTNLIKQLKGVPGVTEETHKSAMNVKHCALSLVGEPIMYPQINELLSELHLRRISTFLVTNAQFPDSLRTLLPVTQLYVSVDAGSQEALKKTDRPLFADFWERYIDSFRAVRDKAQRTVYRLTLVKEYNMDTDKEVLEQYADLIEIGLPDFIEIKAVTFCGASDSDSLTMKNVPWHEEVLKFSLALTECVNKRRGITGTEAVASGSIQSRAKCSYEVACEHKHSCSILIALSKFKVDNTWHTWIDYEKYADLALSGRTDFVPDEYWAPTPEWAVYGADERGFDPEQTRHHRNNQKTSTDNQS